jgi:hypothetical protein
VSKRSKKSQGNEPNPRHRGYLWGQLMRVFQQATSCGANTFYLDIVERRVVSIPKESSESCASEAEHEVFRARLESTPQTLLPIPIYSWEEEMKDWREFLLRFPDPQFRKKLDRASREFNGGSRDLLNRLVEDYPEEEARWTDFREKRMQAVGLWL